MVQNPTVGVERHTRTPTVDSVVGQSLSNVESRTLRRLYPPSATSQFSA